MFGKYLYGAGASALLLAQPAFAHHPTSVSGAGGAGPIYTISATTLDKGQSAASVLFEITRFSELGDAALVSSATATGNHVHSIRSIESIVTSFAYGLTNDLTVSARLPWIKRSGIREAENEPPDPVEVEARGNASGVGDVTVMAQYRFYNNRTERTEAALLLGVKAPTGQTSRLNDQGERFDAEFQPGSGAWDGLVGLAFTRRWQKWSFDTNVLYSFTGKGTQDTDLGDRVLYNAAISYRLSGEGAAHGGLKDHGHDHSHDASAGGGRALDLILELNGEWHANEVAAGVKDPNSGGNTIYISPGLRYSMDKWSTFVSVGIPIVKDSNGLQSDPTVRVLTGFAVVF